MKKEFFKINNSFKILTGRENKIIDKSFWGGIQINENLFAFTSIRVLLNGEDKIIFYNYQQKNIKKLIIIHLLYIKIIYV